MVSDFLAMLVTSVTTCVVEGCTSRQSKNCGKGFFRIPVAFLKRQLWIAAIDRVKPDGQPWLPKVGDRVCSDHFVSGHPSHDPENTDYVPSMCLKLPSGTCASNARRRQGQVRRTTSTSAKELLKKPPQVAAGGNANDATPIVFAKLASAQQFVENDTVRSAVFATSSIPPRLRRDLARPEDKVRAVLHDHQYCRPDTSAVPGADQVPRSVCRIPRAARDSAAELTLLGPAQEPVMAEVGKLISST